MEKATYHRGLKIRKSVRWRRIRGQGDLLGQRLQPRDAESEDGILLGLCAEMAFPTPRAARTQTHVRGALTNWATRQEIREVCMHVSIDRGVPRGVNAFRNAREVFAELDQKK